MSMEETLDRSTWHQPSACYCKNKKWARNLCSTEKDAHSLRICVVIATPHFHVCKRIVDKMVSKLIELFCRCLIASVSLSLHHLCVIKESCEGCRGQRSRMLLLWQELTADRFFHEAKLKMCWGFLSVCCMLLWFTLRQDSMSVLLHCVACGGLDAPLWKGFRAHSDWSIFLFQFYYFTFL